MGILWSVDGQGIRLVTPRSISPGAAAVPHTPISRIRPLKPPPFSLALLSPRVPSPRLFGLSHSFTHHQKMVRGCLSH